MTNLDVMLAAVGLYLLSRRAASSSAASNSSTSGAPIFLGSGRTVLPSSPSAPLGTPGAIGFNPANPTYRVDGGYQPGASPINLPAVTGVNWGVPATPTQIAASQASGDAFLRANPTWGGAQNPYYVSQSDLEGMA